jgi:hypothetical protein
MMGIKVLILLNSTELVLKREWYEYLITNGVKCIRLDLNEIIEAQIGRLEKEENKGANYHPISDNRIIYWINSDKYDFINDKDIRNRSDPLLIALFEKYGNAILQPNAYCKHNNIQPEAKIIDVPTTNVHIEDAKCMVKEVICKNYRVWI